MSAVHARLVTALLVPIGVLVSHGLGYLAAHPHEHDRAVALEDHRHLPVILVVGLPAIAAVFVASVLTGRGGRSIGLRLPRLVGAQVAAFVSMELVESLAGGGSLAGALAERSLWWGIGAQLVVAWVTLAFVRSGEALGAALAGRRHRPPVHAAVDARRSIPRIGSRRPTPSPASRRGPPLLARP